jgi:hypothetical protein
MFLLPKEFYSIKQTKKKGRGVFAKQDIPAGTIVGDYLGVLIPDAKIPAMDKKYGNVCYSMDYNDNGLSIFPVDIKAVGVHLINHSCSPNCDNYFYYGHTLFFTLRHIFAGEELTIDYSFDPEDGSVEGFLHPCFCGSSFCRGTMYTNDAKLRRFGAFCRQVTKGQKFKTLKAGEILPPLERYPRTIVDNTVFNLFANLAVKPQVLADKKLPALNELRKLLRTGSRILNFQKLNLKVIAIVDGKIIVEK